MTPDKATSGAEELTAFDRMIGSNMAENFFANPSKQIRELFAAWIAFTRRQLAASRPAPLPDGEVGKVIAALNRINACDPDCEGRCRECPDDVAKDAADALSALSTERDALREALRKFLAVGGNPIAVEKMLASARALLRPEQDARSREGE